jgi:hypothetical protein
MRTLLVASIASLALALAGTAAAARHAVDRGIVLRVRASAIVLRELDGTQRSFRVGPSTLVLLDGRPAALLDLQRGDVAVVQHFGRLPALRVRAFTR